MDFNEYYKELGIAFDNNGLHDLLDESGARKLWKFAQMLVETNKLYNLTAITDEKEIILKHFVDCASISDHIPTESTLVDVGCGAGFPSIPVAILRPDVRVTALDSTAKRVDFVAMCAKELGLDNLTAVCARAEDFALENRERFDVCTSRAVARLNVLSELCIPLVRIGGSFIAMKSNKGDEELAEAINAIDKLGCDRGTVKNDEFEYNGIVSTRKLLIFEKIKPTPKEYPRNYSRMMKKPL